MLRSSVRSVRSVRSVLHKHPHIHHRNFSDVASLISPLLESLQALQASSHIPWPLFIPLTTIVVRSSSTVPLAVWNRIRARRQAQLQPLLSGMIPILKAQLAQSSGSKLTGEQIRVLAAKERRKRRIQLFREFHCQNWKYLVLPAVQIPIFVVMSLAFRSLCGYQMVDTDFGLEDMGQFLWCPSLTRPDPHGITPLLLGAACLGNLELVTRQTPQTPGRPNLSTVLTTGSRIGVIIFTAIAFQAPVAIQLYWLSSNAFSLLQNWLIDRLFPLNKTPTYPAMDPNVIGIELDDATKGESIDKKK